MATLSVFHPPLRIATFWFALELIIISTVAYKGVLGKNVSTNGDKFQVCPSTDTDERNGGAWASVSVWGRGLGNATAFERKCIHIASKNKQGQTIDRNCYPPTCTYLVLVRSQNGHIQMEADITFNPNAGDHRACYTLVEPGWYNISVVFITSQTEKFLYQADFQSSKLRYAKVFQQSIFLKEQGGDHVDAIQAALPLCNLTLLAEANNEGRWVNQRWYPTNCRPNRITPRELKECLDNKRLLITGDGQMWSLFAELMSYMGSRDRCSYLEENKERPLHMASLRASRAHEHGPVPYIPGSENVAVHTTEFGGSTVAVYYGTVTNGFSIGRVKVNPASKESDGQAPGGSTGTNSSPALGHNVKVVYVTHIDSNTSLYRDWMVDPNRSGPLANAGVPFDLVLASGSHWDLKRFATAKEYGEALESEYISSLRFVVRNMSAVSWASMWAPQEYLKPLKQLSFGNKVRSFAFDEELQRIIHRWGGHWLGTRHMTTPRPDLTKDGTHYSWPVSIAFIELWLGSICPSTSPMEVQC